LLRRRFNQTTEWTDGAFYEGGEVTGASPPEQAPIHSVFRFFTRRIHPVPAKQQMGIPIEREYVM
jgi:hypothetical protein